MNDIGINAHEDGAGDGSASNYEGRFYDGKIWTDVHSEIVDRTAPPKKKKSFSFLRSSSSSSSSSKIDKIPVPPVFGDGKILVSIPSFRDGQRCGETLLELFQKAKDPDNIVVSLIEQNQENEDDPFCIEVYCKLAGGGNDIYERNGPRPETIKIISNVEAREKCPRNDQIRLIKVHDIGAKGPTWARALGRKILGNEEFCLQIATHSSFVDNFDEKVRNEWLSTNNEYGIISNQPKQRATTMPELSPDQKVPRNCAIDFLEVEKLPHYHSRWADGKVDKLNKPLLAHTWAPAFSFAKCHLEESAPYDGFTPFVSSDVEAFARFARFWTRGYDVYTPTQNIVYTKKEGQPNEMQNEWLTKWKKRKDRLLAKSLLRIRSYLEILGEESGVRLDNMGIYGLGKRRTLKQLNEFVGIELNTEQSRSELLPCGNFRWVPYNSIISPIENLYSNPDDLQPQPIYPLRTDLTFANKYEFNTDTDVSEGDILNNLSVPHSSLKMSSPSQTRGDNIPYSTLFIAWLFGLVLWCYVHVVLTKNVSGIRIKSRRGKNSYKNK